MSVVKSLIGSVVGAAVATGIYYVIQQSTGETYIWFPLVTGALTGIVARVLGGSTSNAASFVCGAFAALIAGIAIFGVDLGPKLMEMNADRGPVAKGELMKDPAKLVKSNIPPAASTTEEKGADNSDETDGTSSADANVPFDANKDFADRSRMPDEAKEAEAAAGAAGATAGAGALPKKQDSWVNQYLPYIFNGIGILFAYQIARGFGPATPKNGKDS